MIEISTGFCLLFEVGELLCETFWTKSHFGGARQEACPRYVARRQLQQLDQLGYTLLSAYEVRSLDKKLRA